MKSLLIAAVLSVSAAALTFQASRENRTASGPAAIRDVAPPSPVENPTGPAHGYDSSTFVPDPALVAGGSSAMMNAEDSRGALEQPVSFKLEPPPAVVEDPLSATALPVRPGSGVFLKLKSVPKDIPFQLFNPRTPVAIQYHAIHTPTQAAGIAPYRAFNWQPGQMRTGPFQMEHPQSYRVQNAGYHSGGTHPYFSPMR